MSKNANILLKSEQALILILLIVDQINQVKQFKKAFEFYFCSFVIAKATTVKKFRIIIQITRPVGILLSVLHVRSICSQGCVFLDQNLFMSRFRLLTWGWYWVQTAWERKQRTNRYLVERKGAVWGLRKVDYNEQVFPSNALKWLKRADATNSRVGQLLCFLFSLTFFGMILCFFSIPALCFVCSQFGDCCVLKYML